MSRAVRKVPAGWEHPRNEQGDYIPMHEFSPSWNEDEIKEGLREGWLTGELPPDFGVPVMPDWPDSERTHYQMYEETTEGTPISPVMATPTELARWLADNEASAFGGITATYEQWLAVCSSGKPTVGGVMVNGVMKSGVAAAAERVQP